MSLTSFSVMMLGCCPYRIRISISSDGSRLLLSIIYYITVKKLLQNIAWTYTFIWKFCLIVFSRIDSLRHQKLLFWGVMSHLHSKLHGGDPVYAAFAYGVWTHTDVLLQLVHVRKLSWATMHLTKHTNALKIYIHTFINMSPIKSLVSARFFVCDSRL